MYAIRSYYGTRQRDGVVLLWYEILCGLDWTVDGEEYEGNAVDKYLYEMNHGLMPVEFRNNFV